MSENPHAGKDVIGDDDVARRAELLPEEETVGSHDPQAQAAAILAESAERTEDPEGTRKASSQTDDPHRFRRSRAD